MTEAKEASYVEYVLCTLDEIARRGSKGFTLVHDGHELRVFAVRRDGAVYAYENRCPHTGAPLDWLPDRFLDGAGEHIVCAVHGALFIIHDGRCVAGPCAGQGLRRLPLRIVHGRILIRTREHRHESGPSWGRP